MGARVSVDGADVGEAPVEVRLEPGRPHAVRVGKPGHDDVELTVTVRAGLVEISASAMAGATTASVACCTFPRPWNALMIPHTVPNSPTYGLVEPIVASVERFCSSGSVSRS